jgi:hypothetical protein
MRRDDFTFGDLRIDDGRSRPNTHIAFDRPAADNQDPTTDTYSHANFQFSARRMDDRSSTDTDPRPDRNPTVSLSLEQDSWRYGRTRIDRDIAIEMDWD